MNNFKIIQNKREVTIHGLSIELTKSQNKNFSIIRKHWQYFNQELQKRNLNNSDSNWKKYAVTYKKGNRYFYLTGILKKNDENGFESIEIESGKFAKFEHRGNLEGMKDTISDIYRNIIPTLSGFEIDNDRFFIHFEFYNHRFNWNNENSIIDIYVPVV